MPLVAETIEISDQRASCTEPTPLPSSPRSRLSSRATGQLTQINFRHRPALSTSVLMAEILCTSSDTDVRLCYTVGPSCAAEHIHYTTASGLMGKLMVARLDSVAQILILPP